MEWNSDKSIGLSQGCVVIFTLLLAALDIGAYWFVGFFIRLRSMSWQQGVLMTVTLYLCSIFGWIVLRQLWLLLNNLKTQKVFVPENIPLLRRVSLCCGAVTVISLLSALYYLPFLVVAMAAGFMALIVRIVKNVFQQALLMQDELDLTV